MIVLKTDNICFSYPQSLSVHRAAVDKISVSFEKDSITGIIGHTGSGKSTLLQTFNGLIKPDRGTVFIDGENLWENPKKINKKRFKVGLVFQYPEHQLFEETVYKDIAYGPKNIGLDAKETDKRIIEYTKILGLSEDYLERSPFDLSGGEKRRVALAGTMVMEPEVLVLDEPTAGLDPIGREMLFNAVKEYKKRTGAAIIIVSHSMEDLARLSDRLIVLNDGNVEMTGTVAEVFSNSERLNELGLDVPLITRVMLNLKKSGLDIDTNAFTVDEAVKIISDFRNGGKVSD